LNSKNKLSRELREFHEGIGDIRRLYNIASLSRKASLTTAIRTLNLFNHHGIHRTVNLPRKAFA
jgi:hypothetical protein